nr:hypothetical protein Hi04_10k_c4637_00008 [uncultured bacterium]
MTDDDRRAMGNRGRELVATTFSWPRIGEQMRSVYEWAALGGGPPPEVIVKRTGNSGLKEKHAER